MVKAFAFFLADTFLVLQMPINILPLIKHSSDTVPNTPDANCETVSCHFKKTNEKNKDNKNKIDMNKKLKFALTTIWILFSRSYDAYCTNLLTPDLSKEANPLVTVIGISSWSTLLIILSVLTIYIIYAYYTSVFRPMNLLPKEKGYTFSNFVTYVYLGYKDSWTSTLYKFPKDFKRANNYFGHILTKCLVYAGITSTIMWLLINYTNFYKTIHSATLVYSILIVGCIIIIYNWNKMLYKEYLIDTNK